MKARIGADSADYFCGTHHTGPQPRWNRTAATSLAALPGLACGCSNQSSPHNRLTHALHTVRNYTTVDPKQFVFFSSPELGDTCKGQQGRGGQSSPELGDTCRHRETNVKDCKAEADTAAQTGTATPVQSWETNVKDCKREADTAAQSWVTNVKDCKAKADTAAETCKGLQARGGHSSPELRDKCKGLQARGGHSSPELGDTCKGLRGRGGHCSPELGDTKQSRAGDKMERIARQRLAPHNKRGDKKGDKRKQKGDKADTVTNKKGDKG